MIKLDPYLNIDPGTMNPTKHGEVFVLGDGTETDLDFGNYERTVGLTLTKLNSITAGKIYQTVLGEERNGTHFLGETIQTVPHIVDGIKNGIKKAVKNSDADVAIVEIGGTVGNMEIPPFLEALRQLKREYDGYSIHVTWLPHIKST